MTHASLCSGIGGFDLAAQWCDWENVFNCDIDDFCRKVLRKNFPHVRQFIDLRNTDFSEYKNKIDVLSAGFPCQPFSIAGKQLGIKHEHYLLEYLCIAFGQLLPRWIVCENVPNILQPKFKPTIEYLFSYLESKNYTFKIFNVPASAAGAAHKRERVWIIAHANGIGFKGGKQRLQAPYEQINDKTYCTPTLLQPGRFGNSIPTPRIFRTSDGFPDGVDRIKSLGNAILPQIAYGFFKTIQQIEDEIKPLHHDV